MVNHDGSVIWASLEILWRNLYRAAVFCFQISSPSLGDVLWAFSLALLRFSSQGLSSEAGMFIVKFVLESTCSLYGLSRGSQILLSSYTELLFG